MEFAKNNHPSTQCQDQFVLVGDDEEDTDESNGTKDDGELLGRLETVANFWIRQIREAIADKNPASCLNRVVDELTFWNYRCKSQKFRIQITETLQRFHMSVF